MRLANSEFISDSAKLRSEIDAGNLSRDYLNFISPAAIGDRLPAEPVRVPNDFLRLRFRGSSANDSQLLIALATEIVRPIWILRPASDTAALAAVSGSRYGNAAQSFEEDLGNCLAQ